MKRLTAIALAGVLLLGTACGGGNQADNSGAGGQPRGIAAGGKGDAIITADDAPAVMGYLFFSVLSQPSSENPSMTA